MYVQPDHFKTVGTVNVKAPTHLCYIRIGLHQIAGCAASTCCSLSARDFYRSDYEAHEGRWETTNRHFYVDLPAEKRMVKPEYYNTPVDTSHHIHAALANQAADRTAGVQGGPCGRAGARGTIPHHLASLGRPGKDWASECALMPVLG